MNQVSTQYILSPRLLLPVLILAVIAVFSPHFDNRFIFDDHKQIKDNPLVQGEVPWTEAFTKGVWAHTQDEMSGTNRYYRPLFTLIHRLTFQAGKGSAYAFHVLNLALHITAILLVFIVLKRLRLSVMTALAATAIFALHPLVGETVYWSSCTSELIVQIGLLIALIGVQATQHGTAMQRSFGLAGALAGLFLGLLAKETAVAIAPILTLEVLRHPRPEWGRRLKVILPFWLMVFGYLYLRAQIVSSGLGAFLPEGIKDVGLLGSAMAWYAKQLLIPFPLTTVHYFPMIQSPGQVAFGIFFLALLVTAAILFCRYRAEGLFWLGWLFLPLMLPLVPLLFTYKQALTPVAERYMYLSLVPWCAIIALFVHHLQTKKQSIKAFKVAVSAGCFLVCLIGGIILFSYGHVFHDDTTYFQRAYKYNPGNAFVLQWLGLLEMKKQNFQEALLFFDKASDNDPGLLSLAMNRGFVLTKLNRLPEAVIVYQQILQRNPEQVDTHLQLGNVLQDLGQHEQAAGQYRKVLRLDPKNVAAMSNLGIYLFQKNDPQAAIRLWENALRVEMSPYILFNLARAYKALGHKQKAAKLLRQFLQIADQSYSQQRNLALQWLNE